MHQGPETSSSVPLMYPQAPSLGVPTQVLILHIFIHGLHYIKRKFRCGYLYAILCRIILLVQIDHNLLLLLATIKYLVRIINPGQIEPSDSYPQG